jgi:regulator of sigma E protease
LWLKFCKIRKALRRRNAGLNFEAEQMTFMSTFEAPVMAIVFYVLPYILALIVIVFIHEFGHFIVGRWSGVNVEVFSIGFGREIFGFNDKHGTRWKFCWIPLGGYVRFRGDANAASLPSAGAELTPGSLQAAKLWKRMAIVAAGPFANFLLSILIFAAAFAVIGIPVSEPRVDTVTEDGAAKASGLLAGDYIRKVDGQAVKSFTDIQEQMILRGENPIALQIDRSGKLIDVTIVPRIKEIPDGFGSTVRTSLIGITHDGTKDLIASEKLSVPVALAKGVERTYFIGLTTLRYLGKIVLGSERSNQLHGPLGAAKIAGDFASHGVWAFATFIGLISVSIGLINLFPVPMLDGGHLVFYALEAVLGKPVSAQAQEWSFRIGLSVILLFMIFVTTNDLGRFAAMRFGG